MSDLTLTTAPPPPRHAPRPVVLVLVLVAVALLGACQVQVEVDTIVDRTGAGTVTVSVGLDDGARARVGDPETEVKIQDLRQAGWEVTGPTPEPDGFTWIRASKPFANPDEMAAVLAEIADVGKTGPDRMFHDVAFTRTETDDDITYRVTGAVDLTKGAATFAEPDVAAQLGDPFGGNLAAIEAEEGKPISEMVDFEITTIVAGSNPSTVRPTLTDSAPVPIDVATVEVKPPSLLLRAAVAATVVAGVVVVLVALYRVRRRVRAAH